MLNDKHELLYELCCGEDEKETGKEACINDPAWIDFCTEQYGKILILDADDLTEKIVKTFEPSGHGSIDFLKPDCFALSFIKDYDVIVDLDIKRYKTRRKLFVREYIEYTFRYTNPEDILFQINLKEFWESAKQHHVDIQIIEGPSADKLDFLTGEQWERIKSKHVWSYYFREQEAYREDIKQIFDIKDYEAYINSLVNMPLPIRKNGAISYEDYRSDFCNMVDGYRVTQNKVYGAYRNKLEVYGPCVVFGLFVNDERTIASYLQAKINESKMNYFDVYNMGIRGGYLREYIEIIKRRTYKNGDAIIFLLPPEDIEHLKKINPDIEIMELSSYFNKHFKELGTFFFDQPLHCNHRANEFMAQIIWNLFENNHKEDYSVHTDSEEFYLGEQDKEDDFDSKELTEYIEEIKKTLNCGESDVVGSIVMNCNPFTKGHEYLVQYASSMVDVLIVFVVQENKSYFSFEGRFELVKKGCMKFKNVVVVPSGKYIISSITFPEYFVKENEGNSLVELDMSMDLDIFMDYIAKGVGIQYRFVGEEPMDMVTRQYNESMKNKLPKAGIKVVEIPRKESQDGLVISASRVREYLKEKDWEHIRQLVPDSTYEYLQTNFSD